MKRALFIELAAAAFSALVLMGCAASSPAVLGGEPEGVLGISLEEAIEQSVADFAVKLNGKTRVAIAAFDAEHENVSGYVMDELAGALTDSSLEVADRRNLAYVYQEQEFQMSGDVSDETAVSIGKFLGAKYVITGQLVKAGVRYRYRLSAINVETAVQERSSRLDVRDSQDLRSLIADLRKNIGVSVAAGYERELAAASGNVKLSSAGAYFDRGLLLASQNEFELAIADFTSAITLDGNLMAAYLLRGRALHAGAVKVTGVGENFSTVTSTSTGGKVSETQRQAFDRAIADFTQAIKLDPGNAAAYREHGVVYVQQGGYDKAIDDFNRAIRLNPDYTLAYRNRGVAFMDKGDYNRAIEDYSQVIDIDPNDASAYNNRGLAYYNKGDYDRAIEDYTQAVGINPNYAAAYNGRGVAYYSKNDYVHAREDWNRVLQLDPNNAGVKRNLERLGNRGK